MHHQLTGAGIGDGARVVEHQRRVAMAEPHLGRHRQRRRHRAPDRRDDGVHQAGVVEQHRAAAMAVDGGRRTAEVEVDALGPERGQRGGVVGQAGSIGAEQLRAHRRARGGAAAVRKLGHQAQEHAGRQQLIGDADELRDAAIDTAGAREHVAQAVVEQAFHRREQELHGQAV